MTAVYCLGPHVDGLISWPDEQEAVVYNGGSGDLHLVDISVCYLLRSLQQSSMTASQMAQSLEASPFPITENALSTEYLPQLQALGLVQCGTE